MNASDRLVIIEDSLHGVAEVLDRLMAGEMSAGDAVVALQAHRVRRDLVDAHCLHQRYAEAERKLEEAIKNQQDHHYRIAQLEAELDAIQAQQEEGL
jgi:hypothetical protein